MICAYDKIYLDRARKTLAVMFDYAVNDLDLDITVFFDMFVSSGFAERFEKGDPSVLAGKSGIEIAAEIAQNNSILARTEYSRVQERSKEYWLGWALCYFQWRTSLKFADIVKSVPIKDMILLYSPYHEMDIEQFVDKMNALCLKDNATRLKARRQELGLSQQDLADISGVPKRTIQQYEQRRKNIGKANAEYIVMLAKALCCNAEDLIDIY